MIYTVTYAKVEENPTGGYTTSWPVIGVAFDANIGGNPGALRLKLDALPIDKFWDGSLVLFPRN